MPLDHYISQVHFTKFYSPALGSRMYAMRKSDLKSFTPNSQSVCRINNGSTNSYLREHRLIETRVRKLSSVSRYIRTRLISDFRGTAFECLPAFHDLFKAQTRTRNTSSDKDN